MRTRRGRGQGRCDRIGPHIPRSDQPPLEGDDAIHRVWQAGTLELSRLRGRTAEIACPPENVDDPHALLEIRARTLAEQRHRIEAPGAGEIGLAGIVGHPGGMQRRFRRAMQVARLLEKHGPAQEAARKRRVAGLGKQGTVGAAGDDGRGGLVRLVDAGGDVPAVGALLQPVRHGAAGHLRRAEVEIGRPVLGDGAERPLRALPAADGAAGRCRVVLPHDGGRVTRRSGAENTHARAGAVRAAEASAR